mmetsp:Transcript_45594/g.97423  ORF Transcript_45594/g.97423 Transcript_45594/m.97423 type:complete len:222 (+) Transcript_45594:345-1010(+)
MILDPLRSEGQVQVGRHDEAASCCRHLLCLALICLFPGLLRRCRSLRSFYSLRLGLLLRLGTQRRQFRSERLYPLLGQAQRFPQSCRLLLGLRQLSLRGSGRGGCNCNSAAPPCSGHSCGRGGSAVPMPYCNATSCRHLRHGGGFPITICIWEARGQVHIAQVLILNALVRTVVILPVGPCALDVAQHPCSVLVAIHGLLGVRPIAFEEVVAFGLQFLTQG